MTYKKVKEGEATILAPKEEKISGDLPVFYNPVMKTNRDISIALLNALEKEYLDIALPLAGTGIRAIRFFKELKKENIKQICINDCNEEAIKVINENFKLNNITKEDIEINQTEASLFMLKHAGFNYIDVDPFGSPNPFLDASCKKLSRDGILAVTATDTAPLSGTYTKVCRRKYWAEPKKDHMMHETGLRILIRKIQLIAVQYERALTPIYSYSDEHYMRVFLKCKKGKKHCDEILSQHKMFNDAGPLWLGQLWDEDLAEKIMSLNPCTLTKLIKDESKISSIGFYNIPKLCKKHKTGVQKKFDQIIELIKAKGYQASRTHFDKEGIRTNMPEEEVEKVVIG
jgi:tRNA (guanine26-N2/guanine27-N2)-dimethyltransferase